MLCTLSTFGLRPVVKPKQSTNRSQSSTSFLIILPLLLQTIIFISSNSVEATNYDEANESLYDPERETDGMPKIMAAPSRSLSPSQPLFKVGQANDNEVDDIEQISRQSPGRKSLQKRSDDQDQEDDVDDEDRDEDKSGSSHHDSYESPAFGESQKAAQDGEDIERFFDTHLGPQEPAPAESSSSKRAAPAPQTQSANEQVGSQIESSNVKLDSPDDQYVAAASSPLSDIFHTLIKAHRRPIVIHATEDAPRGASTSAATTTNVNGATIQQDSGIASAPTGSVSSLGVPMPMPIDHSTAAGIIQAAATAAVAPLTLFAPVAAHHPSPLPSTGYEPHSSASTSDHSQNGEDQTSPVRVYIARRPSFISQFRALAAPAMAQASASGGHRLMQQSSDAHWRGLHAPRYVQMDQRPYSNHYAESQDYSRYPVMANSYTNPRGFIPQAHDHSQASSADDESGTVSYNLSFGGGSSGTAAAAPEEDSSSTVQGGEPEANPVGYRQSSNLHQEYPQQAYHQQHQQQPYQGQGYSPMHYSSSRGRHPASTQAYNNYYHQQPAGAPGYGSRNRGAASGHQYQGSRFHKDVSETGGVQPINYAQVYSNNEYPTNRAQHQMATATRNGPQNRRLAHRNRQKLLAKLDEEIKNSPYYRQDATSPEQLYAARSAIDLHQKSKSRLGQDAGDGAELVSYSSFHSEEDPHKSFRTSSKLVTEPEPDNSMQRGSHKAPSTNELGYDKRNESNYMSHVNQMSSKIDNSNNNKNNDSKHASGHKTTGQNLSTTKDLKQQQQQVNKGQDVHPSSSRNLATGPLSKEHIDLRRLQQAASNDSVIVLRYTPQSKDNIQRLNPAASCDQHKRVRREDAEDREAEDADDDGVWVDDDEEDDNRQTASDSNATIQEPLDDEGESDQEAAINDGATSGSNHHHNIGGGILGGPHSYELANDR